MSNLVGAFPDLGDTIQGTFTGKNVAQEQTGKPSYSQFVRDKIDSATGDYTKSGGTIPEHAAEFAGSMLATPAPVAAGEGVVANIAKNIVPDAAAALAYGTAKTVAPDSKIAQIVAPLAGGAAGVALPSLAKSAGNAVRDAAGAPAEVVANLKKLLIKNPTAPSTSEAIKAAASKLYQESADKGGVFTPKFTNKVLDTISGELPTTEVEKIAAKSDPVKQFADEFKSIRDKPLTLSDAQILDEHLGDLVNSEYGLKGLSKKGKDLLEAQGTLRKMMETESPEDVEGGKEGLVALKNARATWHQAMKMTDIEKVLTRAEYSDNPATTLKSGFRTLLTNPSKLRGYSKEEVDALKEAATTGTAANVFRVFGSRLLPMIAVGAGEVVGGLPGAAIAGGLAHSASELSRKAATNLQTSKAHKVLKVMADKAPKAP